jgi:site-specific DNA-cytosine methylase
MSCGQIALDQLGINVHTYLASEIDQQAIKVTQANYPNTIQLGDITKVKGKDLPKIDLLIGGSPCQGFSFAGKQLNFDDPRSKLFFEFVRLLKELKPKYFLLENVGMKKESEDVITKYLGVDPIEINSSLMTAQLRKRLYWTNIPNVTVPKDQGIYLKDIIESGYVDTNKSYCIDACYGKGSNLRAYFKKARRQIVFDDINGTKEGIWDGDSYKYRLLTPTECEKLQGVPVGYTDHVAKTHRYHMLGNGWSVPVIKHIFKNLKF